MPPTATLDPIHCKHCQAVIALLPRASVVNRLALACTCCGVVCVVWPVNKRHIDVVTEVLYSEQVLV